jgi:hypothetical protein
LSYLEHGTDIGNYLNEHDQVGRISEKSWFEFKKYRFFFSKNSFFSDFENYFDFSKFFEIFRTSQNRFAVVRFQFSALWDQISDRARNKNRVLTPPSGQYFDNYDHKVVSYIPMLVCVISVRMAIDNSLRVWAVQLTGEWWKLKNTNDSCL